MTQQNRDLKFIEMALGFSPAEGREAKRALDVFRAKYPDQAMRYYGLVNMALPSNMKRENIYDVETGKIEKHLVSHGSKSGTVLKATKFSNTPNSLQTSLGVYICGLIKKCAKHGYEMIVKGLENTNSNAESRLIVMHPAKYINEAKGVCGRSSGCPAHDPVVCQGVIDKLHGGSLYSIYYSI